MKIVFSTDFRKNLNIKFYQNPSIGSRVIPCGETDITKLIVAFRNFAIAPKKKIQDTVYLPLEILCPSFVFCS